MIRVTKSKHKIYRNFKRGQNGNAYIEATNNDARPTYEFKIRHILAPETCCTRTAVVSEIALSNVTRRRLRIRVSTKSTNSPLKIRVFKKDHSARSKIVTVGRWTARNLSCLTQQWHAATSGDTHREEARIVIMVRRMRLQTYN